jgi:hypothetical protein
MTTAEIGSCMTKGLLTCIEFCVHRVISRAPGLKLVVQTLLSSLRPIGNIVLICCTFFIIFGILGVQVNLTICELSGNTLIFQIEFCTLLEANLKDVVVKKTFILISAIMEALSK